MPQTQLRIQFKDLDQQGHAALVGMWIFLGSEALLFSALFALFAGYRIHFPQEFHAAASYTSYSLGLGMTFTLLTSSFLMAESIERVKSGAFSSASWLLGIVVVLGIGFLALKGAEWGEHFHEGIYPGPYYHLKELPTRGANIFFSLYYVMTGLHSLHVIGGVVAVWTVLVMNRRRRFSEGYFPQLDLVGMYWQFIDIIWLFLWALLYLLR
jgi:cytochrome c oxidase subunit 3